jgi:hypothetical protein
MCTPDDVYTQHGESAQHCTVVLSGRVKITAGMEGFVSESGAFTVLAASALTHDPYITDFSAKVQSLPPPLPVR